MIIENLLNKLASSSTPVAQAIHKSENSKVLVIAFKKGMQLKEHQANLPTTLVVIKGSIVYKQGDVMETLNLYDNHEIPVNTIHSVEASEDAICMLLQG